MKLINSTSNQLIKEIAKLKTTKGRKETAQFTVEGIRTVLTFIGHGYIPLFIFITEQHQKTAQQINCPDTYVVNQPVMQKISNATTPSGFLAVFGVPSNPDPKKLSAGLVLANICDPGNMGTMIRSAAAFGYRSVVIIEGCDPLSPKVLQATAGTLPFVDLFQWSWVDLVKYKKDLNLTALVVNGGQNISELASKNNLLVVGNEAHGLPQEWIKDCDQLITIAMPGKTESLNAAVAGSIALYLAL